METEFKENVKPKIKICVVGNPLLSERDGNFIIRFILKLIYNLSETHYSLKEMETNHNYSCCSILCYQSETHYSLKEMET